MTIKALSKQTFYDISIQYYGTADYAFAIAYANFKSVSDPLVVNQVLQLPDLPKEPKPLQYYKARNIIPATALSNLPQKSLVNYEFPQGEIPISL
ncbi:hypothetical protein [Flavobacterium sp.]